MKAAVGDRLVIRGRTVGDGHRAGIITEVRGEGGTPPFIVKWLDTEHECFVFPGPDAVVEPSEGEHKPSTC